MDKEGSRPHWARDLALFSVTVMTLLAYTGAGGLLGYLAWRYAGAPWWVGLVLVLVGLAGAMIRVTQLARRVMKKNDDEADADKHR
jgi:F0F1-type ATP synthase assembly protein I